MLEIVCYKRTQTQRVRRKNYMALLRSAAFVWTPAYKHLTPPE